MKVLIVDDEAPARRRLKRMLQTVDGVEVVACAADAAEARVAVEEHRPELALLDIHMPEEDGLSLASAPGMPAVIFVTAHDEHAVAAFELAAVDYLLKPVSQARLEDALTRARERLGAPSQLADALKTLIETRPSATPRLTARAGGTWHIFDARQIPRLSARDKYTTFDRDGVEHVLDHSLATLETRLADHEFVRVHRAELVNLAFVAALHTQDGSHELELRDGNRVPVSRRLVPELKRRLGV